MMELWNRVLLLPLSLLFAISFLNGAVLASPPVNVALEASFPSPPWIVELLEASAAENPASYVPLLDSIAAGDFEKDGTTLNEEQLFVAFLDNLKKRNHLKDGFSIASWKLALALREAAPRIQAHYQFWETSVKHLYDPNPPVFSAWQPGMVLCLDADCAIPQAAPMPSTSDHTIRALQFDRVHRGPEPEPIWTLYLDPQSPTSMKMYREWRSTHPKASFRARYSSPQSAAAAEPAPPLRVSGFGVELALKRTDYIVIDDREAQDAEGKVKDSALDLDSKKEEADVKPLSSSELLDLGLKAASYIMASQDPFDTLVRVSQDFPKHASALAQYNVSTAFQKEHETNREMFLTPGYNLMWINGVEISPREIDPYSLLNHVRKEQKLISGLTNLNFSPSEAVSLLCDPAMTSASEYSDVQRYDWTDKANGGNVIMWMNNIEKDKRYANWPKDIKAILQRTYPGQMPSVKRDIQNVVLPLDLTNKKDVGIIVEGVQNFVQRQIAVRFGVVPLLDTPAAIEQAKVVYNLFDTYGLAAVMSYLELSLKRDQLASPSEAAFESAIAERPLRRGRSASSFSEILSSAPLQEQIDKTKDYLMRLGATGPSPPFFANGVVIANDDDWLQAMSYRLSQDLRTIQDAVYDEEIFSDTWVPSIFLAKASPRRNSLIVPEDESDVTLFDVGKLYKEYWDEMKLLQPAAGGGPDHISVTVILDMNTKDGNQLLIDAAEFALQRRDELDLALKHSCTHKTEPGLSEAGFQQAETILDDERPDMPSDVKERIRLVLKNLLVRRTANADQVGKMSPLVNGLGLKQGESAVLVNGRLVGPLPPSTRFPVDDFNALITYEEKKRIGPTREALKNLDLTSRVKNMQGFAKLSSLLALSMASDDPEGIFDTNTGPRIGLFKDWESSHTCIESGSSENSPIEIVASLDPTSELTQRWTPILRVLSKMDGVRTRLFLNPSQKLQELPVKRFYRQVLSEAPLFDKGALSKPSAQFFGIPENTLLTVGLDTPPAWLVSPKISDDDLDNIKLNSIKRPGAGVNAIYELEHILIEGHSRDVSTGSPPRGAQLVLGTESSPDFAGTIVMANLGYFQFKANPGVYNLTLKEGRTKDVFQLDSAGTLGYGAHLGDETSEIALTSFKGVTVFPRLSRYPGKDKEDVLEEKTAASDKLKSSAQHAIDAASEKAKAILAKGSEIADGLLARAGVPNANTGEYLSKGAQLGQKVLVNFDATAKTSKQADINIFSVASGHLYERMLNIMMVSVMRHTNHTVKFWFIEQFLSPSFKTFLPTMAAEYNFDYEMVTFKWPHWLRAQTEKQRIIWGYKILFLDVLFPLDLDKVIFVDADQIVRTDMYDLVTHDLQGAPYGFTPMCDSRTEMEGFRFWKQGYWKDFLRGLPYHISALYVVDLKKFRAMAAGDRLRQQYHQLSADPGSLSNLDQDLPNHMQMMLPIHSLPQDWLWCETWCDDESLKTAKTIDLCNNPQTKEPKLDRARRQVPEWTEYDDEIAALAKRTGDKPANEESRTAVSREDASTTHVAGKATHKKDEL